MKNAGIIGFGLLAIVKFLFTPSAMAIAPGDYSYLTIVTTTTIGAACGVLIFYYFGQGFFRWWDKLSRKRKKKTFTTWRRSMVKIKTKFGVIGLMAISAIISVPITAIIASKWFKHRKETPLLLIAGFFVWANILTLFSLLMKSSMNV